MLFFFFFLKNLDGVVPTSVNTFASTPYGVYVGGAFTFLNTGEQTAPIARLNSTGLQPIVPTPFNVGIVNARKFSHLLIFPFFIHVYVYVYFFQLHGIQPKMYCLLVDFSIVLL